jgi:small-conductance mechanosensitive channel
MAKIDLKSTLASPIELLPQKPILFTPALISALFGLIIYTAIPVTYAYFGWSIFFVNLLQWLVSTIMTGWLVSMMMEIREKGSTTYQSSWEIVNKVIIQLIVVGILVSFLVALGTMLFVIPGIILAVTFSVATPAVVKKGHSVSEAFKESKNFVYDQKNFWNILLIMVISFLIVMIPVIGGLISSFLITFWLAYAYLYYEGKQVSDSSVSEPSKEEKVSESPDDE